MGASFVGRGMGYGARLEAREPYGSAPACLHAFPGICCAVFM